MNLSAADTLAPVRPAPPHSTTWPRVWPQTWTIALVATVVLALGFRTVALDTYGLSEDEINKVWAIDAYRHGHFAANAEHPMLMKLAMWASVEMAEAWNRVAPTAETISLETAIRLPNALAGALTSAALAALGAVFFGPVVGLAAALIWALDPNATSISRLGKEDSFLLLFFLLAVAAYEYAKRIGAGDPVRARPWYTAGGALFGLMLASKYMPHFYGLHTLFQVIADRNPGENKPDKAKYYAAMAAAFLAMNFALLTPETWHSIGQYVQGGRQLHHGYAYASQVYVNDASFSPLGVPSTFYIELLLTKTPLIILGAAGFGLLELMRRRRQRGGLWLLLFLVLLIVPYSLMSGKFLRYALPMVALVDLLAALGVGGLIERVQRARWIPVERTIVAAAVMVVICGSLLPIQMSAAPFYSLQQNALGRLVSPPAARFPEETYDYGVREAVRAISRVARPGAVIVSDASAVVAYYLDASGRRDVRSVSLSAEGLPSGAAEVWVLVQDAHLYFENRTIVEMLRQQLLPWREIRMRGALAVQIFHLHEQ
jgi:hypothetical protein